MSEHTPTPWKLRKLVTNCHYTAIDGGDWAELANVVTRLDDDKQDHRQGSANAAFIIRAVNNHDRLLAACKELLEVAAAAMRAIEGNGEVLDRFADELADAGIKNGFGVRAQEAIKAAEEGA